MDLSEREDQTSDPDEEDTDCRVSFLWNPIWVRRQQVSENVKEDCERDSRVGFAARKFTNCRGAYRPAQKENKEKGSADGRRPHSKNENWK